MDAETIAVLDALAGEHRFTPRERILSIVLGTILGGGIAMIGALFLIEWTDAMGMVVTIAFVLAGAYVGFQFWQKAAVCTSFSREGVEQRAPLHRWFVRAGEIERFELRGAHGESILVIRMNGSSPHRRIQLTESMKEAARRAGGLLED